MKFRDNNFFFVFMIIWLTINLILIFYIFPGKIIWDYSVYRPLIIVMTLMSIISLYILKKLKTQL